MTDRYASLRTSLGLLALIALIVGAGRPASAVPVKYFGQDPTPDPEFSVPAGGGAETARNAFLANLAGVSTESFESFTPSADVPPTTTNTNLAVTFTGSAGDLDGTVIIGGGNVYDETVGGLFATDGTQYALARSALRVEFAQPIAAFGFYIDDIETYETLVLRLRPQGAPTDGSADVILRYTGIINSGQTTIKPGDGQLAFVGFIDKEALYESVEIIFADPSTPDGSPVSEGFGFDELTVGDVGQVTTDQVTVVQPDIFNGPGWRLLSAPVDGVNVKALALQNLVQGVPAGEGIPQQQYPDADPNLFTSYNGSGRYDYIPAPSTGFEIEPGRGFWWYWYDQDINPDNDLAGGGTSESVELSGFALTALGTEITTDVIRSFADNDNAVPGTDGNGNPLTADDDFYMIGNPFAVPFEVSAVSATGGTLQDGFFAWDPGDEAGLDPDTPDPALDGPGSYILLSGTGAMGAPTSVNTWQGFMAEVSSPTSASVEFTLAASGRNDAIAPPFYGRRAQDAYVHFELKGTLESGARVRDEAAYVRFRGDAGLGWDRYDLSKPIAPTTVFALIAPVGERDGSAYRQGVLSLPTEAGALVAPLAFTASEAGTFMLAWTTSGVVATLVDRDTGTRTDLATDGSYTFDAASTDWTERFEVQFANTVVAGEEGPAGAFVGTPFPNPTTGGVALEVRLAEAGEVTVSVFDALGRQVREVRSGAAAAGASLTLSVPTEGLAPGAYQVRVHGPSVAAVRSLTVLR